MAMATKQAPAKKTMCLMFFILMVAIVSKPALVKADHKSPPTSLLIYVHEDRVSANSTSLVVIARNGTYNGKPTAFGTVALVSDILREGKSGDSTALGIISGEILFERDTSLYLAYAYVLNTPSYSGTITIQGTSDFLGNGDLAITGGTGDFVWARGYVELRLLTDENPLDIVYSSKFFIKYY